MSLREKPWRGSSATSRRLVWLCTSARCCLPMPSFSKPSFGFCSFSHLLGETAEWPRMKPRMKPRETETRMLRWHSRLRLVFAGPREEDQIQQVCFNHFILSKTPKQRDRVAIWLISCKNFTKLRHKGTQCPILGHWQGRRYDWITKRLIERSYCPAFAWKWLYNI